MSTRKTQGAGPTVVVLVVLSLAATWLGATAQDDDMPDLLDFMDSNATLNDTDATFRNRMRQVFPRPKAPPIECELVIKGGTNATEISMYGISVAHARLNCTGGVLVVTFHPLLAPFASEFKGVALGLPSETGKPSVQAEGHAAAVNGIPIRYSRCVQRDFKSRSTGGLLTLCDHNPDVVFLRADVTDMSGCVSCGRNSPKGNASRGGSVTEADSVSTAVIFLNVTGNVHFYEPLFVNVPLIALRTMGLCRVTVFGGVFDRTGGMWLMGFGLKPAFKFVGTHIKNSAGSLFGGPVNIVMGHAEFYQCVFESNTAVADMVEARAVDSFVRIGMGGAIWCALASDTFNVSSLLLVNCSFRNNTALQGGAVALGAGRAVIHNCSFNSNWAAQQGQDVFVGLGAALHIDNSSITVSSPTVQWNRDNAAQCLRGEYVAIDSLCRRCQAATFSLQRPASNCSVCPPNAQCPGGDMILPDSGFWRSGDNSVQVLACPRAAACLEGTLLMPLGTCAPGHGGILCGRCDSGFALSMPFKCSKCASKAATVAVFITSYFCLLVVTGVAIQLAHASNSTNKTASGPQPAGPSAGDVFKLLTFFLQYTLILGGLPVPWPRSLLVFFSGAGWLFASEMGPLAWAHSPLECVLGGTSVPPEIANMLFYLCMPIAVAGMEWLLFACIHSCCQSKASTQPVQYGPVVLLVSAFFTFPVWVRTVFSFFSCHSVHDTSLPYSLWWVPNMSQACYHGYHKVWSMGLGVPCLILCCAYPLVLFAWLWRSRRGSAPQSSATSHTALDWVTRLYAPHAYGWEAVLLSQTIILVALSVFATQIGIQTAVLLAGLHLVVSLQILQHVRPYADPLLHRVHVTALYCLLADIFVGLLVFAFLSMSSMPTGSLAVAQVAAAAMALALNACFIVWCCGLTVMRVAQNPAWKGFGSALLRFKAKVFDRQVLPVTGPSRRRVV